ncbi:hypothetical protein PRIPAC_72099 [Pristionchus pacificus]|uniref:Uncharacterized protein n=1 Tax=Pristionchus pacificus TaxID=54126 RepID=A0A2A6C578_PRIPA|nr:hypothetical protein PRIPAC_72099 [Pristionchus pacificus]|eukprot:PDM73372.1 hypothetical protein PRIPAC_40728 [Pristionchus pacificus]
MLTATSIVMISCLIILSIAFCTLGTFAVCRVIFSGGFRKKPSDGRNKGRSFRPRLSSPIYSISSDSGGGKKTQSFYGSPSPVPDQREYLDVSTARESRRDTLSPPSTRRDRSTSKGRISVLHECPFASAPPLHDDASQYSPVKEVFMDVPPQLRRPDRY